MSDWATDDPDYPRRQCQRADWICLNGPWDFHIDDGCATHPTQVPGWESTILVPFAPESEMSGVVDRGFHADVWYQRDFILHKADGGPVLLHFGAVDYRAKVWVNGAFVGEHEGGHTPFTVDISHVLVDDQQTVVVWAHDDPLNLEQPRGKQDWQSEPHSIWYPRTTGIWQTVWVEELPPVHLGSLALTSHLDRWEIGCEAVIAGALPPDLELRVRLRAGDRVLADDVYRMLIPEVHRRIALADPGVDDFRNELLWSPDHPTLIDVDLQLISGGEVIDEVRSYTALRGVAVDRGRFLLNNRPLHLRLVLDQGYWPGSLMTPPSEEAIIRDIELVQAAGFTGVRKHQKIEDPRYLYWADRMGLLVWEEMPSAYRFTTESVGKVTREWMEVLRRDVSHPCIVVWVPFNESWGVPNLPGIQAQRDLVQALYHLTRTLDPSRPVVGNDGWESSATDIVGIHDYEDDPRILWSRYQNDQWGIPDLLVNARPAGRVITLEGHPHSGQPIMLTEFGGIGMADEGAERASAWGYSASRTGEELQGKYAELLAVVNEVHAFAGFCYTQFCDTFQEANGLFYADRTPKFPLEAMRFATEGHRRDPAETTLD